MSAFFVPSMDADLSRTRTTTAPGDFGFTAGGGAGTCTCASWMGTVGSASNGGANAACGDGADGAARVNPNAARGSAIAELKTHAAADPLRETESRLTFSS